MTFWEPGSFDAPGGSRTLSEKTVKAKGPLSLSDQTVVLIAAKLAGMVLFVLTSAVVARALDLSDYGTFAQINLVVGTVSVVASLGLGKSIIYFFHRVDADRRKSFILQTLILGLLVATAFAALLFLFRGAIARGLNNDRLAELFLFYAGYFCLFTVGTSNESILLCYEKTWLLGLFQVVEQLGRLAVIAAVWWTDGTVGAIFLGFAAVELGLLAIVTGFVLRRPGSLRGILRFDLLPAQVRFAVPLAFSVLLGSLGYQIDQIMVSNRFSTEDFAIYTRGAFELPLVFIISSSIFRIIQVRLTKNVAAGAYEEALGLWSDAARRVSLVFFPLFVLFLLVAEPFIVFLFSEKFTASTPIFRIYLLSLPLRIGFYGNIPHAFGKTGINLRATIYFTVSNVVLNLIFLRWFGMPGAAWATVATLTINTFYYLRKNAGLFGVPFSRIMMWEPLARGLGVSALAGTAVIPVLLLHVGPFATLALAGLAYLAAYAPLAWRLGVLHDVDRELVTRYWGRLRRLVRG